NAVFYALSTVAQTCAALAALVGALALYKLQSFRESHAAAERALRELGRTIIGSRPAMLNEVLSAIRGQLALGPGRTSVSSTNFDMGQAAIDEWDRYDDRYTDAVTVLVIFEAWNLIAILASLVAFSFVNWLAQHWGWFVTALVVVSIGTVAVTGGALYQ